MENKERLERATLMAMQGLLANPNYSTLDESTISFESVVQAKDIIQLIDQQFLNQEPQETQEPKQPQIELPEVGQWCWFWDDEFVGYYFGQFVGFLENDELQYLAANSLKYQYCSTSNPTEQ